STPIAAALAATDSATASLEVWAAAVAPTSGEPSKPLRPSSLPPYSPAGSLAPGACEGFPSGELGSACARTMAGRREGERREVTSKNAKRRAEVFVIYVPYCM